MAYPRKHPDSLTRVRLAGATFRAKRRAMSPLERLAETHDLPVPYGPEELETLRRLKACLAEAEALAESLNSSLKGRSLPDPFGPELERATRISLPAF